MLSLRRIAAAMGLALGLSLLFSTNGCKAEESPVVEYRSVLSDVVGNMADLWHLDRIEFHDGRPTHNTSQSKLSLNLRGTGEMSWSDGCNGNLGHLTKDGPQLKIVRGMTTARSCFNNPAHGLIKYWEADRYTLAANTLVFHSEFQDYHLKRFSFSALSKNSWGLESIIELSSGKIQNFGRFRQNRGDLTLTILEDRIFHFSVLDGNTFDGVLSLEGKQIKEMRLSEKSLKRLAQRSETYRHLPNNHQSKDSTRLEKLPQTFAQQINWSDLHWYSVSERFEDGDRGVFLELYAPKEIYVFKL